MATKRKSVKVTLEGMDEAKARLQILGERIPNEDGREAALAGAKLLEEEWKRRIASTNWRESDRHFERSIQARLIVARRKNAVQATVARRYLSDVPYNEQPLWYGHRLELGSGLGAARPTMRPAFDTAKDRAVGAAQRILLEAILKKAVIR